MIDATVTNRWIVITFVLVVAVLCCPIVSGVGVGSDVNNEFTETAATETPSRTVSLDGNEYNISSISTVESGQTLTVGVSVSEGTRFDAYLYNTKRQSEMTEIGTGAQEIEFDTESIAAGSYVLALYVDGNYVDIQPVIVEGYDVSVTPLTEVESDSDSIEIEATVSQTKLEEQPDSVEVAVWNDDTAIRENASHVDDETYQATVSSADLEEGDSYNVYAVARGAEEIEENEPELLGLSDGETFDVIASEEDRPDGSNGIPDGGSNSNGSNPSIDNPDNNSDENASNNKNESNSGNLSDDSSEDTTPMDNQNSSTGDNSEANESPTNPIEPNSSDDAGEVSDSTDSTSLHAVPLLAIATLLFAIRIRVSNNGS